jgi:hypothetical protein
VKDELIRAHHHRVPGIVPALESDDHIGFRREQVHDLSLSFIPPLRSDDHDGRHTILTETLETKRALNTRFRAVSIT